MKTAETYAKSVQELGAAVEVCIEAEAKLEAARSKVILEDPVYGAAKNAEVRGAYLTTKLVQEQAAYDHAAKVKRMLGTTKDMAEIAWKSERVDASLLAPKL